MDEFLPEEYAVPGMFPQRPRLVESRIEFDPYGGLSLPIFSSKTPRAPAVDARIFDLRGGLRWESSGANVLCRPGKDNVFTTTLHIDGIAEGLAPGTFTLRCLIDRQEQPVRTVVVPEGPWNPRGQRVCLEKFNAYGLQFCVRDEVVQVSRPQHPITALVGGLANCLDDVPTFGVLNTGDVLLGVVIGGAVQVWQLQDCPPGQVTDIPNGFVLSVDYNSTTNNRIWVQLS